MEEDLELVTMQAAVLERPGHFRLVDLELEDPKPHQVAVRLQGCGVCASNIPPFEGRDWFRYPMPAGALGHEGWGIVEAVGAEVQSVAPGDRVAMLSEAAYATHDLTTPSRLVKLPRALDGEPFPGEPLACAYNVFDRSRIGLGQRVAVIGVGFMGAVIVRLASLAGADVIAISRRDSSLALAEQMGAKTCVRMDDHDRIIRQVDEETSGALCDRVIECVGSQWPLDLGAALTATRGCLVVAGYHQDGPRQVDMQLWNWRGIDVINAHERDDAVYVRGMKKAVAGVLEGELDLAPLLTHAFSLERLGEALEIARDRPEGFVKALLRFD